MERKRWVSQKEYWDYFFQQDDGYKLVKYGIDKSEWNELFCKYVMVINIETSSLCNRKCSYCPVGYETKIKEQEYLKIETFNRIIAELSDIEYEGDINLCMFNEPMLDKGIISKVQYIRKMCPNCRISFNSNGDFLTRDKLDALASAGLNQMFITAHTLPGKKYIHSEKKNELEGICRRLEIPFIISKEKNQDNITCLADFKGIELFLVANNWEEKGVDRGGSVPSLSLKNNMKPCFRPFREIAIAHDGCVRLCTNIYTSTGCYGSLENESIKEIYFSDRMVDTRRSVLCYGDKPYPHKTCRQPDLYSYYDPEKEVIYKYKRLECLERGRK